LASVGPHPVHDKRRVRKLKRYLAEDVDLHDLVAYRLQCVSEATKNVLLFDPDIAVRQPEIWWQQARAIGNRLRHEYGKVDTDIVWEAVSGADVRSLVDVARAELGRFDD